MYFLKFFLSILLLMITTKLSWSMSEEPKENEGTLVKCTKELIKNIKKLNKALNQEQSLKKPEISYLYESKIRCFHCNVILKKADQINDLLIHLKEKHNAKITEFDISDRGWYISYGMPE